MTKKALERMCVLILAFIGLLFCFIGSPSVKAGNEQNATLTFDDVEWAVQNHFPILMEAIKNTPQTYWVQSDDLLDVKLLSPIRVITPEYSFEQLRNSSGIRILHIPVTNTGGDIKLIFSVVKSEGSLSCSLGPDFANGLNELKNSGTDRAVVYQDRSGVRAYAVDDAKLLAFMEMKTDASAETKTLLLQPYISTDLFHADNHLTVMAQVSFQNLKRLPQTGVCDSPNHTEETTAPEDAGQSSSYPFAKQLSNYPIVHQRVNGEQKGLCWAATVASMVRFEKPSTYGALTAKQVADYMNIGYDAGATLVQSRNALSHYLGNPYRPTNTGVLSTNAIKAVINNIDPAYLFCRRKAGNLPWSYAYHAVAMTGYDFNYGFAITIMDPAYECFKSCINDGVNWTFPYGDTSYTWNKTTRLLYST